MVGDGGLSNRTATPRWPSHVVLIVVSLLALVGGVAIVAIVGSRDGPKPSPTRRRAATPADAAAEAFRFTDVTASAGLARPQSAAPLYGNDAMTAGVAVADVFGSGRPDIYITRIGLPNSLYRNNGDGTFTDVAEAAGVGGVDPANGSHAAAIADVDADGCLDLYVSPAQQGRSTLYMNNCNGTFREEAAIRGIDVTPGSAEFGAHEHGATFGDFDLDGDLDLLVLQWDQASYPEDRKGSGRDGLCSARRRADAPSPGGAVERPESPNRSRLYRNDGKGHFEDVTASVGLDFRGTLAFTGQFADLDGDGWPELLVTGDVCTSKVFHNERGRFVDVTHELGVGTDENGMGSVLVDIDDDGHLDWFVTSISHPTPRHRCETFGPTGCSGNRLYRGRPDGTFEDATDRLGLRDGWWGWGAAIEDFNDDGSLEVVQTNGMREPPPPPGNAVDRFFTPFATDPMRFWVASGGRFRDVASRVGLGDRELGVALVPLDFDDDGDLDVLIARNHLTPLLYRNDTPRRHRWLTVKLDDPTSPGNRQALGADVIVTAGGHRMHRRMAVDGSYESQKPAEIHVGLGDVSGPVQVEVTWPGGHQRQQLDVTELDRTVTVVRSDR